MPSTACVLIDQSLVSYITRTRERTKIYLFCETKGSYVDAFSILRNAFTLSAGAGFGLALVLLRPCLPQSVGLRAIAGLVNRVAHPRRRLG